MDGSSSNADVPDRGKRKESMPARDAVSAAAAGTGAAVVGEEGSPDSLSSSGSDACPVSEQRKAFGKSLPLADSTDSSSVVQPSSSGSPSSTASSAETVASSSSSSAAFCSEVPYSPLHPSPIVAQPRPRLTRPTVTTNSAPLIQQKRGPGRPRKDGSTAVAVPQRRPPPSNPFLRTTSRPRGRRRVVHGDRRVLHGDRVPLPGGHFSALPMQARDFPKLGEASAHPCEHHDKTDCMELDSDNSLSSDVSTERSASVEMYRDSWSGRICSFCNLGEKSLLGQGEMMRFEPTPGYNPFRKSPKSRRGSTETERDTSADRSTGKSPAYRKPKGRSRERSKSPRRSDDDSNSQPIDELSIIGFGEQPEIPALFELTGHIYAHHCCAAWSDGVCQNEQSVLINVDRAVVGGISQKCSNCHRHGATIRCRGPKCNKAYHYPCAASSGAFQDIKSVSLLCPQHHHLAPSIAESESNCIVCDSPGNISELLFCTSCGHHYHGHCLDPAVAVNPVVRAGWQCPDCKICQTCRQPGDDNKMLVCDTCDKGYHTYCLRPVMTSIPKHGWKCKNCRTCGDCGSRTPGSGISSRWHMNYSVCDSCYQQRNKGYACPLCGCAYRHFAQKDMIQCLACRKYVHEKCDGDSDLIASLHRKDSEPLDYTCPPCRSSTGTVVKGSAAKALLMAHGGFRYADGRDGSGKSGSGKVLAIAPPTAKDDGNLSDSSLPSGCHDHLLGINEDSVCSMDIDIQAIERGALQLQQLSGNSNFSLFDDFAPHPPIASLGKLTGKKKMGIGRPRAPDFYTRNLTRNTFISCTTACTRMVCSICAK